MTSGTATTSRPLMSRGALARRLSPALTVLGALVVWEAIVGTGLVDSRDIPAPPAVFSALGRLVASGRLPSDCARTLLACMSGWAGGAVIGILLGYTIGLSRLARRFSYTSLVAIRTIPPVAFVPLLLLILGYSVVTEIVIAGFATACTIAVYALVGIRSTSETHRELGAVLQLGALERVRKLDLPSAMPSTFVGLRVSLALSLSLTVISEMFATSAGVGYGLIHAQQAVRFPDLYAYVLVTGVLSLLLNLVLLLAVRVLAPGFAQYMGEE